MATVLFYEKPGCRTNARQRRLLEAAGHVLLVRNLLTEVWTTEKLRRFFGDMAVGSWFNPAAPSVRSGIVDPDRLGAEEALALMLADPLLIRRPLIEAGDRRCAGFDQRELSTWLGLPLPEDGARDPQACSRAGHEGGTDIPACPDLERNF